jgi:pimeloyl-ACP methyl ester carboxylesterase
MNLEHVKTGLLDIACEIGGPPEGPPVMLLHGWPDDARAWRRVAPKLQEAGFRTIAPYLRGFGPTGFLSAATLRDGRGVALAQDAIDLADALAIPRFAVVGHDWGARAAYSLGALFPERITHIAAISLPFQPLGAFRVPDFAQARRIWYQWFMTSDAGGAAVRADPKGFARIQWETWSPPGWFEGVEFEATAQSFANKDWVDVTLHGYRSRWRPEKVDQRYDGLQRKLESIETLNAATLMIQGDLDNCDAPLRSEGQDRYFTSYYRRALLPGVGHFPPREAPDAVADLLLSHLRRPAK